MPTATRSRSQAAFCGALACALAGLTVPAPAQEPPRAEITNGVVTAKFYLPDPQSGYYRGTRFDWSGNTYSLTYKGHEFVGQWFERYDPKLHDAVMGPVEEFLTGDAGLGFAEVGAGETFVRIGVGVVRRPDDKPYDRFRTYDIVDTGRWAIETKRDRIVFKHELADAHGHSYLYRKTMRLLPKEPVLVIDHLLRNTGMKPIETQVYDHNFFVLDGQPTGPGASVRFAFEPKSAAALGGLAEIRGKAIEFPGELQKGQSVFGELTGFSDSAKDYDIRIESRKAGTGVRIQGNRPLAKLVFWAIRTTLCPEPYVQLRAEPGRETSWSIRYELYELAEAPR